MIRAWLLVAFTLAATVSGQIVLKLALQRQGVRLAIRGRVSPTWAAPFSTLGCF